MYGNHESAKPDIDQLSSQNNTWLEMSETVQPFEDLATSPTSSVDSTDFANSVNLAPPLPGQSEPKTEKINLNLPPLGQSEPKLGEVRDLSETMLVESAFPNHKNREALLANSLFESSNQNNFTEQLDATANPTENLLTNAFNESEQFNQNPLETSESSEPAKNLSPDQIKVLEILEQINQDHDHYQSNDREQHHELDQLTEIFTQVSARLADANNKNSIPDLLKQLAQQYIQQAEQSPSAPTERENLQKAELCLEQQNLYSEDKKPQS